MPYREAATAEQSAGEGSSVRSAADNEIWTTPEGGLASVSETGFGREDNRGQRFFRLPAWYCIVP